MMRLRAKASSSASPPSPNEEPPLEEEEQSHVSRSRRDTCKIAVLASTVLCILLFLLLHHFSDEEEDRLSKFVSSMRKHDPAAPTLSPIVTMKRRNDQILADTRFVENCPLFPAPFHDFPGAPTRMQKCCPLLLPGDPDSFYCLPNLVIAGVQKGGTTALFSYLMEHPEILIGSKKEFHLFDFDKSFMQLRSKLKQVLPRQTREELPGFIILDSSPTYIADSKACPRMSTVLSPDARFVIILRNPIDRTWSDVQMKQRRIDAQEEFKRVLVPRYHREIAHCLRGNEGSLGLRNLTEFRACLPPALAQHGRIAAFHKYFATLQQRRQVRVTAFIANCLGNAALALECMQTGEGAKALRETMPNVPQVIYDEARALQRTMQTCCQSELHVKPKLERQNAFYGALPTDMGCGMDCFPQAGMMSDISKNFVWRSMFSRQLKHCFASVARERFLIINSEDLRHDALGTLRRILIHAGLDAGESAAVLASVPPGEVLRAFEKRFPDFETMTGWRHDEQRPSLEMPSELREYLRDFFRPYNRELFDLLQIEPYPGWEV